ncbi:hypothetical protein C8F01DRAFT_3382 [Mycena amicta]|nr:hypothetical protein C8F01DRAFT_3382 [Mycena amicta]
MTPPAIFAELFFFVVVVVEGLSVPVVSEADAEEVGEDDELWRTDVGPVALVVLRCEESVSEEVVATEAVVVSVRHP